MKNKKIDYKFYTILTFAILIILITIFANYLAPYNPDIKIMRLYLKLQILLIC